MWARNSIQVTNHVDSYGNPTGGSVDSVGLTVHWQDGPLGRSPAAPNGAFVEDLIEAARQRLAFYQQAASGKFACRENALAITKLEEAAMWLQARRAAREARGVQGTHQP